MNETLKNELCMYLGMLIHQHESEFDWHKKGKIAKQINAACILLDIDKQEKNWYQKLVENLKTAL